MPNVGLKPQKEASMSKPIHTMTFPAGNGSQIQVAIWENQQEKDGQQFKSHSVTIQRRYRDGEEWKTASGFRVSDLLIVAHASTEAYRWMRSKD